MALRTFYVPAGYEVSEVRVRALSEREVSDSVRLATREARLWESETGVMRSYPSSALAESGDLFPALSGVSLGGGSFGGYRLHTVGLFPVRWSSVTGQLVFTDSFELELELVATSETGLRRQRTGTAAEATFGAAVRSLVENAEDVPVFGGLSGLRGASGHGLFLPEELPSVEGSGVDMVIVTLADMADEFQVLADWKTQKGIPTVVRTLSWVETNYPAGHDTAERIRLFLQDAYAKWGTYLVLLAGDYEEVPPREAYNRFFYGGAEVPTDQYYACLEGDWNGDGDQYFGEGTFQGDPGDSIDMYPDVYVGRAPVESEAEATNFVTKSQTYEKNPPSGYVEAHNIFAEVLFPSEWEYGDPPEEITLDGKTLA
ncbi:MAG: hypothetical protein JSW65_01875, partial [Candidatus Bipolaricaulota bacterium]